MLSQLRSQLHGTVKFIQPAEEVRRQAKTGALMVGKECWTRTQNPSDLWAARAHAIRSARSPTAQAASWLPDDLKIVVHGRSPQRRLEWRRSITAASQIVMGLQTIVSRQTDLTRAPLVLTIGRIEGLRFNIIPDSVTLYGTVRTLDPLARTDVEQRIKRTAEDIAAASGATAEMRMGGEVSYP